MPARARRAAIAAAASGVAAAASSQLSGRNSRQFSGQDAASVTAQIDTPPAPRPTPPESSTHRTGPDHTGQEPDEALLGLHGPRVATGEEGVEVGGRLDAGQVE